MLSRQSDLLVTNIDLLALEEELRGRGDVLFLSNTVNERSDALLPLPTLALDTSLDQRPSLLCYLAPATGVPNVRLEVMSAVKTSVKLDQSELIALWRSYVTPTEIRKGNIYYTPRYSGLDGILHDKDQAFVAWARSVFSTIKRSLAFQKKFDAYVGSDARQKIDSGELTLLRI